VTFLVAVDVGLAAFVAFVAFVPFVVLAAGLAAAFLGAGLVAERSGGAGFDAARFALAGAASAAGAATSAVFSAAAGSACATPMELERVRWQVSHVTMVRTRVPR